MTENPLVSSDIAELLTFMRGFSEGARRPCERQSVLKLCNAVEAQQATIQSLEAENATLRKLIKRMDDAVDDCCGCLGHIEEDFRAEINAASLNTEGTDL